MTSLGPKNVVALQQEGLQVPTEISASPMSPSMRGRQKALLARELQVADYDIDLTRLLSCYDGSAGWFAISGSAG
jgi:hypothetical protein